MENTTKDDCILHVYGWGVSMTYVYTQRRPCTKYFLPNSLHQVERLSMINEYREQIVKNPPKVVVYSIKGADFDIKRFEKNVLNLPSVLKNCYIPDSEFSNYDKYFQAPITVYWPKKSDKKTLEQCLVKYGVPK